jgi:hypothetical protein
MPRYILIDDYTGYIWGDTADLPLFEGSAPHSDESMIAAARALDESIGGESREYEVVSRLDGESGYRVYRADVNGSDAVPVFNDGQDKAAIEAVERDCDFVGCVAFEDSCLISRRREMDGDDQGED